MLFMFKIHLDTMLNVKDLNQIKQIYGSNFEGSTMTTVYVVV